MRKWICLQVMMSLMPVALLFAQQKPNVVIIIANQWRGQAMGFIGKEKVKTPFIDSFAKQSFVVTQMTSNFPLCSPARAMLFTGKYPFKNINTVK